MDIQHNFRYGIEVRIEENKFPLKYTDDQVIIAQGADVLELIFTELKTTFKGKELTINYEKKSS